MDPLLPALLSLPLLLNALRIMGNPQCPAWHDVEAQLEPLLPPNPQTLSGNQQLAQIDATPDGLRVRLFDEEGQQLAERLLPAAPCDELATEVATVLALWESQLVPSPRKAPPRNEASRQPRHSTLVLTEEPPLKEREAAQRWRIELAPILSVVTGPLATSGLVGGFSLPFAGGNWSAEIWGLAEGQRQVPLGPGFAEFQRFALALTVEREARFRPVTVGLGASALAGLLWGHGVGFSEDAKVRSWDPGLALSLKIRLSALRLKPFTRSQDELLPWLGLWGVAWPSNQGAQLLTTSGILATASIPALEVWLGLGLSLEVR